jgi:hypothetical protein
MEFNIPASLKVEHKSLYEELSKASEMNDKMGVAARAVMKVLHPHFMKEEEYALPPLGLLPVIIKGNVTLEMRDVIKMTDKLKAELPKMLEEHKTIIAELKNLTDEAKKEKKIKYARYAEKLILHTQTEEEVYYPTTIMIGEYMKKIMGLKLP